MKHYLVLSGGGMKGAMQAGAISFLRDQGIKFNGVAGISVGALNAGLVGQDKIDEMINLWKTVVDTGGGIITAGNIADLVDGKLKINFKKLYDVATHGISKWDIVKAATSSVFKGKDLEQLLEKVAYNLDIAGSLLDNTPLFETLKQHVKIADYVMPCHIGLTSLQSSRGLEFNQKNFHTDIEWVKALLASATMPVIWKTVPRIQSKMNTVKEAVDGGLRTVSPIGQLFDTIDRTNDEATIWVINCNSRLMPPMNDFSRLSTIIGRVLDILLNQVFNDDLDFTLYVNENAEKLGKKKVTINIIEPDPGTIGETLDARRETIEMRIDMGKALASKYF